jgi:hypothetical protein
VVTASPLHWGNLLQQQPQQAGGVFASFSALADASAQAAPARPAPAAAPAVDMSAEVQARILSIAAEVISTAIDPSQSLMEVRVQGRVWAGLGWGWPGRGYPGCCAFDACEDWLALPY